MAKGTMFSKLMNKCSVFALLFTSVVAQDNLDSSLIHPVAYTSEDITKGSSNRDHSILRGTRDLQEVDLNYVIETTANSFGSIAEAFVEGLVTVVLNVIANPSSLVSSFQDFLISVSANIAAGLLNVVSSVTSIYEDLIVEALKAANPIDLGVTQETSILYSSSGSCTVNYTINLVKLYGLDLASVPKLTLSGLSLGNSVLSTDAKGSLKFEDLYYEFTGNLSSSCELNGTYLSNLTFDEPSFEFDFGVVAEIIPNETTNTDFFSITKLDFRTLEQSNYRTFVATTDISNENINKDSLDEALSKWMNNEIDEFESATTNLDALLETYDIELPLQFDTGINIPL